MLLAAGRRRGDLGRPSSSPPTRSRPADSTDGPFVFLNACQVGVRQARSRRLRRASPRRCCSIGATGVVAPLWNVDDDDRWRRVARDFYAADVDRDRAGRHCRADLGGRGGPRAPGAVHARPPPRRIPPASRRPSSPSRCSATRDSGSTEGDRRTDPPTEGARWLRTCGPKESPSPIGTVRISTPGLAGRVEVYQSGTAGMRGAESSTAAFRQALDDAGMVEQLTVEITGQRELDTAGGSRGGGGGSEIVVEVPPPGTGNGQLLLYAAEDGSLSWHLPDDVPPDQVVSRGGDRRTYRLPREVVLADPASAGGQRGILGAVGSKLFKILVFPLIDPILGKVGDYFAGRWEQKNRRNLVRWFDPGDYRRADVAAFAAPDWTRVSGGTALLFIHGTTAQSNTAFDQLPAETLTELGRRYGGRVFALDHFTISVTPHDNIRWLAEQLAALGGGSPLTLDIVSHSRGGLVGRVLAERAADVGLAGKVTVRNLVMVAAAQRRDGARRQGAPVAADGPGHRPGPVHPRRRRDRRGGAGPVDPQADQRRRLRRAGGDHGDGPGRRVPQGVQHDPGLHRDLPRDRVELPARPGRLAGADRPERGHRLRVPEGEQRPRRPDRRGVPGRRRDGVPRSPTRWCSPRRRASTTRRTSPAPRCRRSCWSGSPGSPFVLWTDRNSGSKHHEPSDRPVTRSRGVASPRVGQPESSPSWASRRRAPSPVRRGRGRAAPSRSPCG